MDENSTKAEVPVGRALVQRPGGVRLGAQDGVQPLRGEPCDGDVIQDAGRVEDRSQWVLAGNPLQKAIDGVRARDVASGDGDARAGGLQAGDQLRDTLGLCTPAADQEQVPGAVPGDQVRGEQPAECPRAAGDQHGPLGIQRFSSRAGVRHTDRSRHQDLAPPNPDLRLMASHSPGEALGGAVDLLGGIKVDQQEPARMLGLGRPHQAPKRGPGQIVHLVLGVDGLRSIGDERQGGGVEAGVSDEGLDQRQGVGADPVGRRDGIPVSVRGHQEELGTLCILRQCGAGQGRQVRQSRRVEPRDRTAQDHPGRLGRRAQRRPGLGRDTRGWRPAHLMQRGRPPATSCLDLRPGHRTCHQGLHRGNRQAHGVGHDEAQGVPTRRLDPHPAPARLPPGQSHAPPRERQEDPAIRVVAVRCRDEGMQAGVQQSGVDAVAGGLDAVGQLDLGGDAGRSAPGRREALEDRAVPIPPGGQRVIEPFQRHGFRAERWPGTLLRRG